VGWGFDYDFGEYYSESTVVDVQKVEEEEVCMGIVGVFNSLLMTITTEEVSIVAAAGLRRASLLLSLLLLLLLLFHTEKLRLCDLLNAAVDLCSVFLFKKCERKYR